ncbi:acid phosphatase [Malassezia pachydermatis]
MESDEHGRPILHSVPSHGGDEPYRTARGGYMAPGQEHVDAEVDHAGRPPWLRHFDLSRMPPARRRMVQLWSLLCIAGLLAGLFYFALSPSSSHDDKSVEVQTKKPTTAQRRPASFPTYIGWPGSYETGTPPQFADEMQPAPTPTRGVSPIQTSMPEFDEKFNPFYHMGPLSPYYSAQHGDIDNARYLATPESANGTCSLRQVHILHRHGSRYPTKGAPTEAVSALLAQPGVTFDGPLAFLSHYTYRLGSELLVPLGREQLHMSGVKAAMDYGRLAADDLEHGRKLLVRTGSQQRIVDSALAWATGFWGNSWVNKTNVEIQIEEPGFNTTLAPNFACSAAAESFQVADWVQTYLAKATKRLQAHVHGATLTPAILFGMQQLCSYDTVAYGRSEFCHLFTEEEWRGYEFAWDQRFYYDYGAGNVVGPAMGLGWLNEMLHRMTHKAWDPATQTSENATLNNDAAYFPVDRAIYADFTHDSVITSVLAAMRLKELGVAPSVDDPHRAFRTSQVVPFGARMVFEVFDCPSPVPNPPLPPPTLRRRRVPLKAYPPQTYVRMKLNDAIVPLRQLEHCEDRVDGLCTLRQFLASHADRHEQGWWAKCTGA